ncbi:MAG: LysM peptidoglycan-binding domain-containing protein [Parachlamydiaceae bacterium]
MINSASQKGGVALLFILLVFVPFALFAAAPRTNRPYDDNSATAINDMRNNFETIKHQVNNHETEIRIFDEKLKNLDSIIESVRDQVSDSSKNQKDLLKGSSASLEAKITALEATSKGLVADLRQFQTYANESTTALTQYKQKILELEKITLQQNQDIENLQSAIHALMDLIQGKKASPAATATTVRHAGSEPAGDANTYCIKQGDSLEKIARAHQTTIQALKDLNGLTSDKIVVGKNLKIPPQAAK